MTIINWIFIGLLAVDTGLLIFSLIKKIVPLEKTCLVLFFPLSVVHGPLLLLAHLPDSYHTVLLSVITLSVLLIAHVLNVLLKNHNAHQISYLTFSVGIALWCELFRTVFFIHRIPLWLINVMTGAYIIIIVMMHIFSGKRAILRYITSSVFVIITELLHFISLSFLIFEHNFCRALFFAGSTLLLLLVIFNVLDTERFRTKYGTLIHTAVFSASQMLISLSTVMIFMQ